MTDVTSIQLSAPTDWQAFERLTRDLFECEWDTNDAQLHGRSGQPQHGVDVYGTDRRSNELVGVQCKGKNGDYNQTLKEKELRSEVEKAKKFTPPLRRFILATTAPNDANIQKVAREIDDQHRKSGLFEVSVMGWDEIKHLLNRHPKVAVRLMSGVSPMADLQITSAFNETFKDLQERMAGIEGALRDSSMLNVAAVERDQSDDPLGQRITDAADLLNDSPPQTAISRLKKLLENEGQGTSPRNRFRIKANLGAAYFAMGDKEAAVESFREAHDEYPDTAEGISILAAAESIAGNTAEAASHATRAMQMPEPQQRAAAVFLGTAPSSVPWEELQQQLPEQFRNVPEHLLALAEHAQNAGQIQDCRKLIKDAVRRDPENWRVRAHAGYLRFQEVAEREDIRSLRLLRKNDIQIVEDAREHFLEAWKLLKGTGWVSEGETAATNAISASLLLGDEERAEALLDEAFRHFGDTPHLLRARLAQQMDQGLDKEILATIRKLPEDERDPNDELMFIQAMIHEGNPAEALKRATDLYSATENEDLQIAYASCRIIAAARISDEEFLSVAPEILDLHQDATLVLAGYVFNYPGGDIDQEIVDRLAAAVEMETNSFALDRAAHALAKADRSSVAADTYKGLCSPDTDTPQLRMALRTLVESRRNKEAKALYSKVDATIKRSASMRRIGATIFHAGGNLKAARDELAHVFGTNDETLEDRAHWIDICERIPDLGPALEYLKGVPVDISGDPRIRMHLAHKVDRFTDDHGRALEIGYRALRDGYDDPLIHVGYMVGLVLAGPAGRHFDFEVDAVTEDAAVVVARDHGEPFTRVIETSPAPRADKGEIPVDDPLAQRLLGKTVGESFEMDSAMGPQTATVEKIVSKYAHAYHLAQKDFEQLFPESKIFGALRWDDSDPEGSIAPILDGARVRAEQVKRIEEAYETGKAPISLLAKSGGGTPFDFWDFLRHHPKIAIKIALGSGAERQAAIQSVANAPGLIVDPITLYAAQCLGFADTLVRSCPDLHITQSSIDLLHEAYLERSGSFGEHGSRGSLVADEDGFQMVERSEEASNLLISDLRRTLDLARTLKIAMPEEGMSLNEDFERLFADVGPCFIDTLIVAKEKGFIALIDDLALRLFAALDGIPSAWSQVVLQHGRQNNLIAQEEYSEALSGMIEGNCHYVSIDGETIRHEWENPGKDSRKNRFFEQLTLPSNDPWSVAQLIGSGFLQIWSEPEPNDRCSQYATFLHQALSKQLGAEGASKVLQNAVSAAVARAQRNARAAALPSRLKSSTHIVSPAFKAVDINQSWDEQIRMTIGRSVQSAIQSELG